MLAYTVVLPVRPDELWLFHSFVLLYVGPDQILPLTSALGAILGVVLMFWHRLVALCRRAWRTLFKARGDAPAARD